MILALTEWDRFKLTLPDIIKVSLVMIFCAMMNASMDITKHNFKHSIFSKISEPGTSVYKYFQSDWKNKWVTDENNNIVYDDEGNKIPKYFLNIHLPLFNHPLFFDSWHLFKTLMIGALIIMIMIMYFKRQRIVSQVKDYKHWLEFIGVFFWFGVVWNIVFNLFYNNILRI